MPSYRTNVALLIRGDRVARGSEIELSTEQAAAFDPADITPVEGIVVPVVEVMETTALEAMSHAELKARAKELELSAGGSKADLQERIKLHLQKPEPKLVDFVVTEEYLAENTDCDAKVGDTIQVPEEEITNA